MVAFVQGLRTFEKKQQCERILSQFFTRRICSRQSKQTQKFGNVIG